MGRLKCVVVEVGSKQSSIGESGGGKELGKKEIKDEESISTKHQ